MAGGRGYLALFYVEVRRPDGHNGIIQVNRLKDKLGTRKSPTAELTLDGALATPVSGLSDGIQHQHHAQHHPAPGTRRCRPAGCDAPGAWWDYASARGLWGAARRQTAAQGRWPASQAETGRALCWRFASSLCWGGVRRRAASTMNSSYSGS